MQLGPRLAPNKPFPPYAFVPGRFPHPVRDSLGHSFGHVEPAPAAIDPRHWSGSQSYLFGCDLFNHGYYWEAHETWESLWIAAGRQGPIADFLKGLIKLAAAGVKAREGRAAGVTRHARRARELFHTVQTELNTARYLGLDLAELCEFASRLLADPPVLPASKTPVEIAFDFTLLPSYREGESPAEPE